MRRAPTLKTRLSLALVLVAGLAALASGCLALLTTMLHRTHERATLALDGVRLAEEAQRDLLLHERVANRQVRAQIASSVRERLVQMREHAPQLESVVAVARAERACEAYFAAAESDPVLPETPRLSDAAYEALDAVLDANDARAAQAREEARRWDMLADAIAVTVALIVTAAVTALLWWVHRRAFHPIFGIAVAMQRFERGARDARAPEEGPTELRQMAARFNEMAASLERQREAQQTLLAGIAHDLRTPLGALRLSWDALSSAEVPSPERRLKIAAVMHRQLARLDRMVSDVLDTASLEAGHLELRLEEVDARDLVRTVTELFEATSPLHELRRELPPAPVWARCDAARIEQVLVNLVSNAIKYSPEGGAVTIAAFARDGRVTIAVRDEGIGMAPDEARSAFEPFRRTGSLKEQVPGTGLGLHVARRLVEAHGGSLSVRSARGEGSTFEIDLPAAGARDAKTAAD
jgi:signal transduction histidine kinase